MSGRNAEREEWVRWYYSVESRERKAVFVPTVHIRRNEGTEASIQMELDEKRLRFDFPSGAVRFSQKEEGVRIGSCFFSSKGIVVRLEARVDEKPVPVTGRLVFSGRGPFCKARGFLDFGGERLSFQEGRAWIEKERERLLPSWDFRCWCAWTGRTENSLSVRVTQGRTAGNGSPRCRAFLNLDGRAYRLNTAKGARILKFDGRQVLIVQGGLRLHVKTASGSLWCRFWKRDRLILEYIGAGGVSLTVGKMQKRGART